MRLAEESTNIPLVTQGQSGPTQPDTLGGMQPQNNNANQLLRQIGYSFDDYVTEPMVRQFYEYLLLDPDVPSDEKGDFAINAHGSAALVERAIQDQMLAQMLTASLNPAYGLNPRKTMSEFLKSKRFDPRTLENTEEEQARIDAQPPPAAPQVEVAKIRAETEGKRIEIQREDVLSDRTVALAALDQQERLAILGYAEKHKVTIEQVKAKLAQTRHGRSMRRSSSPAPSSGTGRGPRKRVRSQRVPQVASTRMEPIGRAANGRAFEQ